MISQEVLTSSETETNISTHPKKLSPELVAALLPVCYPSGLKPLYSDGCLRYRTTQELLFADIRRINPDPNNLLTLPTPEFLDPRSAVDIIASSLLHDGKVKVIMRLTGKGIGKTALTESLLGFRPDEAGQLVQDNMRRMNGSFTYQPRERNKGVSLIAPDQTWLGIDPFGRLTVTPAQGRTEDFIWDSARSHIRRNPTTAEEIGLSARDYQIALSRRLVPDPSLFAESRTVYPVDCIVVLDESRKLSGDHDPTALFTDILRRNPIFNPSPFWNQIEKEHYARIRRLSECAIQAGQIPEIHVLEMEPDYARTPEQTPLAYEQLAEYVLEA